MELDFPLFYQQLKCIQITRDIGFSPSFTANRNTIQFKECNCFLGFYKLSADSQHTLILIECNLLILSFLSFHGHQS